MVKVVNTIDLNTNGFFLVICLSPESLLKICVTICLFGYQQIWFFIPMIGGNLTELLELSLYRNQSFDMILYRNQSFDMILEFIANCQKLQFSFRLFEGSFYFA
jgi:hypothetical protein